MANQTILLNEICHICGKVFKAPMHENNRTCPVCRYKLRVAVDRKSVFRELRDAAKPPKKKRLSEAERRRLDAEQFRLNKQIDNRYNVICSTKIYKPGTPEFEAIVSQITPIERIPKTDRIIGIQESYDLSFMRRGITRREAVNEL